VTLAGELAKVLEVYATAPGSYPWNVPPPYDYTAYIDYLDKIYLAGQMSQKLRGELEDYFAALVASGSYFRLDTETGRRISAYMGVLLVTSSPDFTIQK
jgi:hypothetical protein